MDTDEMRPTTASIELAAELTMAWLANPNVTPGAEDVPAVLRSLHKTLGELEGSAEESNVKTEEEYVPAVPVRSSVKPDYIVSLITGQKLKSLKRHLSAHGLTPEEYRERYGLKPDYPMVAAQYSAKRREVAVKLGLGRKPGQRVKATAGKATTARRGRTKKADMPTS